MDAFVAKHLQGVSRTYAIVVPMLPMPLADAVGVAYLLMRIVDTLEDAPQLTAEERVRELRRLEAVLAGDTTAVEELARPLGEAAESPQGLPKVAGSFPAMDAGQSPG